MDRPLKRVEIDLNVRVRGNMTYVFLYEVEGGLIPGELVTVFEAESDVEGDGEVAYVEDGVAYLKVDWRSIKGRKLESD